jgi:hypothetical protein
MKTTTRSAAFIRTILPALVLAAIACRKSSAPIAVDPSIMSRVAAIAAVGEPTTLEQLDRFHPEPPPGQNAAPLYLNAFASLHPEDANSPTLLEHNAGVPALLLQAAERTSCRYPIALTNGALTLLPHLSKFKLSAKILQLDAVRQATANNAEGSAAAIVAGIRLARSLDNEPFSNSKLVQYATLALVLEGLERSLSLRPFSGKQLDRVQAALLGAEEGASVGKAMIGERVVALAAFESTDEKLAEILTTLDANVPRASLARYRRLGFLTADCAFTLDYYANAIAAAATPFPQAFAAADRVPVPTPQAAFDDRRLISAMFLSANRRVFEKSAEAVARIRIARTVLAVEHHRLRNGGVPPATLDDLFGDLTKVPADPYDGKPLRYVSNGGRGYKVWSISARPNGNSGDGSGDTGAPTNAPLAMTIER